MGRKKLTATLLTALFLLATLSVMPVYAVSESNVPGATMSEGGDEVKVRSSSPENILVYSDDANFVNLEDRPPLVALRNLGYSYTAVGDGDYTTFEYLLTTGGPWDLVIYDEENYGPPESVYNALNEYITSGGKAIVTTWWLGHDPGNLLWTALGVSYASELSFEGNRAMYLWDPTHQIFRIPNTIPNPLIYNGDLYTMVDGILVNALSGATAIAGDAETPQAGKAIIVVRNDGQTIFNGVLKGCMNMDQDSDGKTEAVELWENEITFILGPTTVPVGGTILAIDKMSVILPWLLIAAVASGTVLAIKRRRL